jgi:hypothetical protein
MTTAKPTSRERRGIDKHIADADKAARTGNRNEQVRNTPPFGDYDQTDPKNRSAPPKKKDAP